MAVLLMAGAPCIAKKASPAKQSGAKATPKRKNITLKRLIEIAMKKGEAMTLDAPRAAKLGYEAPPPAMDFIAGDLSKDSQLSSIVILKPDAKTPDEILFSSTTVTQWVGEEPIAIDGYSFRCDIEGRLIAALHVYGKVGEVSQDVMPLSPQTKKRFESIKMTVLSFPELVQERK